MGNFNLAARTYAWAVALDRYLNGEGPEPEDFPGVIAGDIAVGAVTAETIEATAIDGMVITGATFRTAPSGQRVVIDSANGLRNFDASGNLVSQFFGSAITLVGGTFTGSTFQTATSGQRMVIDGTNGIRGFDGSGNLWCQFPVSGTDRLLMGGLASSDIVGGDIISKRGHFVASAETNASLFGFTVVAGSYCALTAGRTGTGTQLPLKIFTAGSERLQFPVAGHVDIAAACKLQHDGNDVINTSRAFVGSGGIDTAGNINTAGQYSMDGSAVINTSAQFVGAGGISVTTGAIGSLTCSTVINPSYLTSGSVLFYNGSSIAEENTKLFYDSGNDVLMVGLNSTDAASLSTYRILTAGLIAALANGADGTDDAYCGISVVAGSYAALTSGRTDSGGTYLPLAVFVAGAERSRFLTNGQTLFGITSTDLTAVATQVVIDGSGGGGVYVVRATADTHVGSLTVTSTSVNLNSTVTGSGTQRPLRIFTFGEQSAEFDGSDSSTQTAFLVRQNGSVKRVKIIDDSGYGGDGSKLLLYVDA